MSPIENVNRNASQPPSQIEAGEVERTTPEERAASETPESNESNSSESSAREARTRMLESQMEGKRVQAELQNQLQSSKAPEQSELHHTRTSKQLDQVEQKLDQAQAARQKLSDHLNRMQDETKQIRSEIQDIKNDTANLEAEIEKYRGSMSEAEIQRARQSANHPLGQMQFELAQKKQQLNQKLNRLIDESASVHRSSHPGGVVLNTAGLKGATLETKLQGLEEINQHSADLLHGTGKGSFQVKVGDQTINAKGLDDYIAKLQNLHKNLQAEEKN